MYYRKEYERWIAYAKEDELADELQSMSEAQIEDAFYRELKFGTGGIRGVIGAGTNRINVYTVAKVSQGLANYIKKQYSSPSIVISFDSRRKSDLFSKVAGEVLAANGIKVWRYEEPMPTPCLSYAVRALECSAGIMITASHNPARYNGYKVYGSDGCQITTEAAKEIFEEIEKVDIFGDVKRIAIDPVYINRGFKAVPPSVYDNFIAEVLGQSVLFGNEINQDIAIVYSPLNGTGLKPVTRILQESGFTNITVVKEQEQPDGNFPTCPYPNPETQEAMKLGIEYASRLNADLLLATDPDADRCGIAVKDGEKYKLLSGNEVGLLLLDFICSQRIQHRKMPMNPVFIKTIVTMDLAEKIAESYGVETINVLTGFKFIGEIIGKLEDEGRVKDYICGFEESYGYLTGTYVRDKDGVNAAFMICEMFAFYKTRGISLVQKLEEIYSTYGYCLNTLHSYKFDGSSGMQKMKEIMQTFRKGLESIAGHKVVCTEDYSVGVNGLPKSDVLKFRIDHGSVVIRPSGTEPKLKVYISVTAESKEMAGKVEKEIIADVEKRV